MKCLMGWSRWVCLSALFLSLGYCLPSISSEGAPCESSSDCFGGLFCVDRLCQTEAGAREPREAVEPTTPDAAAPEPDVSALPELPLDGVEEVRERPLEGPPEAPVSTTPQRKRYESCVFARWATKAQSCVEGLSCYRVDAFTGVCLQSCSTDTECSSAPDETKTCRAVDLQRNNQPQRVCVKEVNEGQICDPAKGIFCALPSICRSGTCVKASLKALNEPCDPKAATPEVCDISKGLFCTDLKRCDRSPRLFEWDECFGNSCAYENICRRTSFGNLCTRPCQTDLECNASPQKSTCRSGNCHAVGCTFSQDCKYSLHPMLCNAEQGGNVCVPRNYKGDLKYNELCESTNPREPAKSCGGFLLCLRFLQSSPKGLCTLECSQDSDCQSYDPAARCISRAADGSLLCATPCFADNDCDTGRICGADRTCILDLR